MLADSSTKVGMATGGAGVKVSMRVGTEVITNCAARVEFIVGVTNGVGVGGGSMIGISPGVH